MIMPIMAIKKMKDFLTTNGPATKEEIVAAVVAAGAREKRAGAAVDRWFAKGKLSKVGDDYDLV